MVPGHGRGRGRPAAVGPPPLPPRLVALLSAFHPAIQSHFLRVLRLGRGGGWEPAPGWTSPGSARQPWAASPLPPGSRLHISSFPTSLLEGLAGLWGSSPSSPPPRGDAPLPALLLCFSELCLLFETVVACPWQGRRGARRKTSFVVVQLHPATLPHHSPPRESRIKGGVFA